MSTNHPSPPPSKLRRLRDAYGTIYTVQPDGSWRRGPKLTGKRRQEYRNQLTAGGAL